MDEREYRLEKQKLNRQRAKDRYGFYYGYVEPEIKVKSKELDLATRQMRLEERKFEKSLREEKRTQRKGGSYGKKV